MFALLLAATVSSGTAAAEDLTTFAERLRPSAVTLVVEDGAGNRHGSGSGFFLSADGLVVTNHHVIDSQPTVALLSDGSRRAVLGLLVSDEDADVAIVRIEGSGYPALPLGDATTLARGAPIVVIGAPLGFSQTVSDGIVSALYPDGLPAELEVEAAPKTSLLQITASVAPGSSGSPVLDMDGAVVGVVQSGFGTGDVNFAVAIEAVKALQARAPADGALQPLDGGERKRNLVISAVFFSLLGALFFGVPRIVAARERREKRES